tara:strand:+ start:43665 stop:46067 length:2403 start_codon:yes stop_codon:yes gene_type:complete
MNKYANNSHSSKNTTAALSALSIVLCANMAIAQSETAVQPHVIEPAGQTVAQATIDILLPQRRVGTQYVTQISTVDVDVRLTDTLATTSVQITVVNNGSNTQQARLVLPVPNGSSISTFGIDGIGDEPTAKLLPRAEATRRYNEIVAQMIDPGLLEFVGSSMIQSSVFPVEPGASRTMTIVYEQSLDAHRGRVEYVLPRSASYADSSIKWSINLELEAAGKMGPVFSPSHPVVSKIESNASGNDTMKINVPMLGEPGAFRLYAMLGNDASNGDATAMLYPDGLGADSGYFMFVADAPQIDMTADTTPREITIVVDRSGSMNGQKIIQAREAAKQIVLGMKPGEFVHIIDYADDVRSFTDLPVEITTDSLPGIIAYIDGIQSRGGTNLHDAMLDALDTEVTEGHLPMVLFLTDGLASVGVTGESDIRAAAQRANTHGRRVFTFGIGYDVNVPLLDGLAMDTRAESTFVAPNEDVEMKVGQVFDKLDGPVMLDPVFGTTYAGGESGAPQFTMVEPRSLGDLFSGSRVVILGRYANLGNESAEMWVASDRKQQKEADDPTNALVAEFSQEEASNRYAFIARLWAQKRMDSLINEIRLAGADGTEPNQELVDEIVRLSLEHGIMSEYTAFLAEEEMQLSRALEVDDRGRTRAYRVTNESISTLNERRSGAAGVSQMANRQSADAATIQSEMDKDEAVYGFVGSVQTDGALKANKYYDADMNQVVVNTIQRGQGSTLYKKQGQWVDAQLGEMADEAPELTIEFASDEYWALVEDLVKQDRQWVLANRGDVYFMNHSQRVLVKNPK